MYRREFLTKTGCVVGVLASRVAAADTAVENAGAGDVNPIENRYQTNIVPVLIDDVAKICKRLAPKGWRELLLAHGIDITASDLRLELSKALPKINRRITGFEDFAPEGVRGIEAGSPSRSLLFHALASPMVTKKADGTELTDFPTLAEIESVENYVFGAEPPTLDQLTSRGKSLGEIGIVVFASEYRPGAKTVHRRHADMCFSRTGVCRVGTAKVQYMARERGFLPFVEDDVYGFRVLPARYTAYVAVKTKGDQDLFGPRTFKTANPGAQEKGDQAREFWIPLHKLFDGKECIKGLDLKIALNAHHKNDKIRRIHLGFGSQGHKTGWGEPDLSNPPFIFTENIAKLSTDSTHGKGLLVPTVHPVILEQATYKGKPLTFKPPDKYRYDLTIEPSLLNVPQYIDSRRVMLPDGQQKNLGEIDPTVLKTVVPIDYEVVHIVDYTGEGSVGVDCIGLPAEFSSPVAAYSVIGPLDFFPYCDQRDFLDWIERSLPKNLYGKNLWGFTAPTALSDERYIPNPELPAFSKGSELDTVTSVISLPLITSTASQDLTLIETGRQSFLPDAAAGYLTPGWDIGVTGLSGQRHFSSGELASPFTADVKLCAALSGYWPGTVPDATRTFDPESRYRTIVPITDEEIGMVGQLPWDGVRGPSVVQKDGKEYAQYLLRYYADYVGLVLSKKFTLALTGKVSLTEYCNRTRGMARAYVASELMVVLDDEGKRMGGDARNWVVLSFRKVPARDAEVTQAVEKTKYKLADPNFVYRFEFRKKGKEASDPTDFRKWLVEISDRIIVLVDADPGLIKLPAPVLLKQGGADWELANG